MLNLSVDCKPSPPPPVFLPWPVLGRGAALLAGVCLVSSCTFFTGPPPLPRRAAVESTVTPGAGGELTALVENADILYFPSESVDSSRRNDAPWTVIEALAKGGGAFALGWDMLSGDEQPLLDGWAKNEVSTDDVISRLRLHGAAAEVETCRRFLREAKTRGVSFLALRCPNELTTGISEESSRAREAMSREFKPPEGDFESFVERYPAARATAEPKLRAAYEAALLAETFAASRIAARFRENRHEKILVFVRRAQLSSNHGVPFFVAQKTRARQLILNLKRRQESSARLLAGSLGRGWREWRGLEIVNGPPIAAGDEP